MVRISYIRAECHKAVCWFVFCWRGLDISDVKCSSMGIITVSSQYFVCVRHCYVHRYIFTLTSNFKCNLSKHGCTDGCLYLNIVRHMYLYFTFCPILAIDGTSDCSKRFQRVPIICFDLAIEMSEFSVYHKMTAFRPCQLELLFLW